MRALQVTAPGTLELREVPLPAPGPGELLVRVSAAGICHSDLHVLHADWQRPEPMTLGHEIAGTVAAVGTDTEAGSAAPGTAPVGTAGVVYLCWSCGTCRECTAGRQNLCLAAGRFAMPPCPGLMGHDGGMAEYVVVPTAAFVPTDIEPAQAAPLADAALTSYHAIDGAREHLRPGGTAVVIGVGGLGHIAVQILRAVSPVRVIAVDVARDKLDAAARLGAEVVLTADDAAAEKILRLTGGRGADAVFDFVGVDATAQLSVRAVAPGGAYRMVGLGGGVPGIAADGAIGDAWPWGASIKKSYAGTRNDLVDSLALAAAGTIHAEVETFPLAEGPAVFERLERGGILGRAVLIP
ncbi:NAD(P)-dependent alcohol dehydrogenase [Tomitella fengzijianii]|uniref:alcohol dehydrogenase n=1 Tax=Tomitella fengzijianii TaxID=2597660 RepID=A0A516X8Y7_9ACTN|nr:NAD(P)-dependent alcohol dehydrogenase [Tomitella fengzijianii]QDQ99121.1 NAD(P)-dependent alcohol dehydrogenase [Tomitella fengzijianii]